MSTDPDKTDLPGQPAANDPSASAAASASAASNGSASASAAASAASTPSASAPAGADAGAGAGGAPEATVKPEPAAPPERTAEQKLADAVAETARIRDQLLRTAADFDNFRKRSRKAEDDALRRGRENLLKEILPVFDNLERAVQHAEGAPEAQAVSAGLRMVLKQFLDTLEKLGIKRIVAIGKPFDPSHHEAIQQLESTEHPAGVVIAEVQAGYQVGDTLIRPTMVVVSKGPPAAAEAPSA
jgi:molecular chaperone GrpE